MSNWHFVLLQINFCFLWRGGAPGGGVFYAFMSVGAMLVRRRGKLLSLPIDVAYLWSFPQINPPRLLFPLSSLLSQLSCGWDFPATSLLSMQPNQTAVMDTPAQHLKRGSPWDTPSAFGALSCAGT